MKYLGLVVAALLITGCSHADPMTGRAGSDLPPGPLQPLPSDSARPAPACTTLALARGDSERAAGLEYVALRFTNTGESACSVHGYPAVTLKDADNRQVGETARAYVSGAAKYLEVAPGETVTADLRFPNPDNFEPGQCETGTTKLEVLIPGATERASIADTHAYCPGWTVSAIHRAWG